MQKLKRAFLDYNCVFVLVANLEQAINSYFENLSGGFELIKKCNDSLDVFSVLDGPVCNSVLKRLN